MRYLLLTLILAGCASNPLQEKRNNIMDCTERFIKLDTAAKDSYDVCKDLYSRSESEKRNQSNH